MNGSDSDRSVSFEEALVSRVSEQEICKWTEEYALPYRELISYCRCAMGDVETRLQRLAEEFFLRTGGNPLESLRAILKSPEEIADAVMVQGIPLTVESIEQNIHDIARVEAVCTFPADVYALAEALARDDDVLLLRTEDYIKEPKESGYRSLHLLLSVPVTLHGDTRRMKAEVVLRTPAMELWVNAERKFSQKKDMFLPEQVARELRACAELSAEWDQRLEQIRYNMLHRVITK